MNCEPIPISNNDNVTRILSKRHEDEKSLQFLMGLKSNFGTIRSNILNEKSWSNVNEAYFKIIQEEQVQKMIRGEEHGDTVAYAIRNNNTTNRSKLFCSVCNKTGHESKDCFTIIGYLDW